MKFSVFSSIKCKYLLKPIIVLPLRRSSDTARRRNKCSFDSDCSKIKRRSSKLVCQLDEKRRPCCFRRHFHTKHCKLRGQTSSKVVCWYNFLCRRKRFLLSFSSAIKFIRCFKGRNSIRFVLSKFMIG